MPTPAARSPPLRLPKHSELPLPSITRHIRSVGIGPYMPLAAYMVNYEFDSRSNITFVLAGQPELRELLKYAPFAAVRQRIRISYHMPPMSLQENLQLHRPPHRSLRTSRLALRR